MSIFLPLPFNNRDWILGSFTLANYLFRRKIKTDSVSYEEIPDETSNQAAENIEYLKQVTLKLKKM